MTQDSQAIKEKIDKIEYLNIEIKKKKLLDGKQQQQQQQQSNPTYQYSKGTITKIN